MGSICSRRPSVKADIHPLWLPGQELRSGPQDFDCAVEVQEPDSAYRPEESKPILQQSLQLLPAIAWALCGWSALVGFPEAMYWHFLDPYSVKTQVPPLIVAGGWALSFLVIDCCGLQRVLSAHAGTVSLLPPALFALSALPFVEARSVCLTSSAGALGWSAAAVLGSHTDLPRRQRDGWACLISLSGFLMLRWTFASESLVLTDPYVKVGLGCCGLLSAFWSIFEEMAVRRSDVAGDLTRRWPACGDCRGLMDCGNWPAAAATGLMGSSALVLFQTYLSSLEVPSQSALLDPSSLQALWALAALTFGTAALAAVYSMVPWWLDTCQAALFIGGMPLLACSLQWTADEAVEGWGLVQGTGSHAHAGLLVLAASFPFMLALFGKELYLLARSRAAGRALFVAASVWLVSFQAHFAVVHGGAAPSWGKELAGRPYRLALLLGVAWSCGVLSAPNGAGRPSVHELWYMSQHSVPKRGMYTSGALLLLWSSIAAFLGAAVPSRALSPGLQSGRASGDDATLVVSQYNVQQGFDAHGWRNTDCVTNFLRRSGADLVGLPEASAPRLATGNVAVAATYAHRLHMYAHLGAPGALASVDGGILSKLPFQDVSVRALKVLSHCDHCPTQTHLWTRSRITWKQVPIDFHSVHTEWFADATPQLKEIAKQIHKRYASGPLILVGTFNLPHRDDILPARTELARLLEGTGLKEAFNALASNASLPLEPTEFVSGLHLDYIFYRDLELVSASIFSDVQCSDHMPLVASFRLGAGAGLRAHVPLTV